MSLLETTVFNILISVVFHLLPMKMARKTFIQNVHLTTYTILINHINDNYGIQNTLKTQPHFVSKYAEQPWLVSKGNMCSF